MPSHFARLMLVTQKQDRPLKEYLDFVETCASQGVTSVQLREKKLNSKELASFARSLLEILRPLSIPLIINDHLDVAISVDADGVHLGQSDGDVEAARKNWRKDKIIGVSVNNKSQLLEANLLDIDYIGLGAIFPTQNKPDVETIWGLDGLKLACLLSKHPVVAIGGINHQNIKKVTSAGAFGIAAIGMFHPRK